MQSVLTEWQSFYVITGSSGAALTGLMFVVIALAADRLQRAPKDGLGAFSTPTVAHFAIVLLLASFMSMPLRHLTGLSICLAASAIVGLVITLRAGVRMVRLESYAAVVEDWIWNVIVPFAAYVALFVSAALLAKSEARALFAIAAIVLVLLFLGIRNAWDVAVYLVTEQVPNADAETNAAAPQPAGQRK
jgi:hypothetical protein